MTQGRLGGSIPKDPVLIGQRFRKAYSYFSGPKKNGVTSLKP